MISAAFAGLLISPISWTHHWVWVLLIPPMIVGQRGREVPRAARIGLWGVVALTVTEPYWWFGDGIPADVLDALLPLCAAGSLAVWAASRLAAGGGEGQERLGGNDELGVGDVEARVGQVGLELAGAGEGRRAGLAGEHEVQVRRGDRAGRGQ
jgi:hypothetical protein